MKPYADQERAIAAVRNSFAQGHVAPLLQAPCGFGKTVVLAAIANAVVAKRNRVLIGVGRIELGDQAEKKLHASGVRDCRVIQADRDEGPRDALVTVASIPTLTSERWLDQLPEADLFIIDEAHHVKAETWERIARKYTKRLGLSATPQRGDGRNLGDMFDDLIVGATVRDLVAAGRLAESRVVAPSAIVAPRELALDPVVAFERYALDSKRERAIVFAQTRTHAVEIAHSFIQRGYRAASIDGLTRDRRGMLEKFARGEIQILTSVAVLVEGFDDPGVSVAILAKRFTHAGSYIQAGGRILRPHPEKKRATLIDLCGSALVHGPLDIDRTYSLEGSGISKTTQGAVRHCAGCGGVYLAQARTDCPFCGFSMPVLTRAKPKSLTEQLHEVTKDYEPRAWNVAHARGARLCRECGQSISNREKYVFVSGGPSLHPRCAFKRAETQKAKEAA